GEFAFNDHRSFHPAISHRFIHVPASMARQTYHYINYSPTTITVAARENWPTLSVATMAPRPSCRAISAIPAASLAPQCRHKNVFTPAATIAAPRPSHKVTPTVVVITPTWAIRPPCKVAISVVPAASPAPRRRRKSTSALVIASPMPRPSRKGSFAAVITTLMPASWPL
ncbi:hypothetical protein ACLOJK_028694, partial [Asimina triloba]